MTVHLFIGTKAQWIKMAPVLLELRRRHMPIRVIDSGQHGDINRRLRGSLGLPDPDLVLAENLPAQSLSSGLGWLAKTSRLLADRGRRIRRRLFADQPGVVLVHGDNLTTALGVALARRAGLPVGIVEAGLRSRHPLHPFPEELLRMSLPYLARVLFAPSPEAVANLRKMKVRGHIVNTGGNTIADTLRLVLGEDLPEPGDYGLWNFHRLETLLVPRRLERLCRAVLEAAERGPVKFIMDLPTRPRLEKAGWLERFRRAGVELLPVMDYPDFVRLLARARYAATDGGSIQEECALLGVPCLLLRQATERPDGLGGNANLLAQRSVERFLDTLERYRRAPSWPDSSPTRVIIAWLEAACLHWRKQVTHEDL